MSSQKFPSCIWTGEQLRIFIRDHLGPLFEKHRCTTEIWLGTINAPETDASGLTGGFKEYANRVLNDEKARHYVKGVGYQWAGKCAIQRTRQAWPAMPVMQTENECGDGKNTWQYAFYVFDLSYHYIVNGACAYTYWNMVLEPGGESSWGLKQNALFTVDTVNQTVTRNPEYYIMKHFSHFARTGARHISLQGPWSGNAVGFASDASSSMVLRNPFPDMETLVVAHGGETRAIQLAPSSVHTIVL